MVHLETMSRENVAFDTISQGYFAHGAALTPGTIVSYRLSRVVLYLFYFFGCGIGATLE